MIPIELAERVSAALAAAGRAWTPASGDRFRIPDRDLDEVFVIADMTIETADLPTGRVIRFNGTTEWALDTIEADEVVWLPWEHQLRAALGDDFVSLERTDTEPAAWVVVLADGGRHVDLEPETAYARALLSALGTG